MNKQIFKTYSYKDYRKLSFPDRLKNYLSESDILLVPKAIIDEDFVELTNLNQANEKKLILRKSVLEKLQQANQFLLNQFNWKLKIYETYRSLKQQKKEFEEIKNQIKLEYPNLNNQELWEKTTQFIADPDLCPPHSTGGAIDLSIVDEFGKELDFGVPLNSIKSEAAIFHAGISIKAKKNREILLTTMLRQGFAPMTTEWWHFSYGDAYWAALYDLPQIFAKADL